MFSKVKQFFIAVGGIILLLFGVFSFGRKAGKDANRQEQLELDLQIQTDSGKRSSNARRNVDATRVHTDGVHPNDGFRID